MPFKSEKQRKWMHANNPEMAKKWEKKEKKMKRVKELIKKMVREEMAEMNEVRIPFSSSHIKQLKRAFKDMKGTLPDNNPLVQKIVQLLKGQDKKTLQQLANADIKYLSDKAKDILGEGKLNERLHVVDERYVGKYIIWVLQDGNKIRTAVLGKKGFDNFSSNDPDDLKKLWNLTKKFKGKPIPDIATEGKLTEKKKTIPLKDVPSYMRDNYPTQKHWDYWQSLPKGKKYMYYKKYPKILAQQSKKTDDFIEKKMKELGLKKEGKLTEAKESIFDVAARVMKDKQAYGYKTKKGLVTVDVQTANLLTKVFKKVNPKMKKILSDLGYKSPTQLMNTLWAVVK